MMLEGASSDMGRKATEHKTAPPPGRIVDGVVPPPPKGHRGSRLWSTSLTEDDIVMIRRMSAAGWSIMDLAKKYDTTWHTMSRIVKGESWTHVEMPGSSKTKKPK